MFKPVIEILVVTLKIYIEHNLEMDFFPVIPAVRKKPKLLSQNYCSENLRHQR